MTVERDSSLIAIRFYNLDSGRGPRREKFQQCFPVKWRAEAQTKQVFIFLELGREMRQLADLRRRPVVGVAEGAVEAAHAAKASGERDLSHRQTGLVDQFLGEVQAARLGYGHR